MQETELLIRNLGENVPCSPTVVLDHPACRYDIIVEAAALR